LVRILLVTVCVGACVGVTVGVAVLVGVTVGVVVLVGVTVGVVVGVGVVVCVFVGVGVGKQYSQEPYKLTTSVTYEFEEIFESSLSYVTQT
jgi:hypothetical protein